VSWRTERSGCTDYSGLCCVVNRFKHAILFFPFDLDHAKGNPMNNIVYIVGAVVIILAILGFLGLR
jgi:hypothetical protein